MFSKYDEIRARRARGDKGFTLIELLVVVVIIGILIAIAIPLYLNYQTSAKKKSVESDARNAVIAVENCVTDHNGVWAADTCGTDDVNAELTAPNTLEVEAGSVAGSFMVTVTNTDIEWEATYDSGAGGSVTGQATS